MQLSAHPNTGRSWVPSKHLKHLQTHKLTTFQNKHIFQQQYDLTFNRVREGGGGGEKNLSRISLFFVVFKRRKKRRWSRKVESFWQRKLFRCKIPRHRHYSCRRKNKKKMQMERPNWNVK